MISVTFLVYNVRLMYCNNKQAVQQTKYKKSS